MASLTPGERVDLIQSIYSTFAENNQTWAMIDMTLDEFGAEWSPHDDAMARTLARVRSLSDDDLLRLNAYLHPDSADPGARLPTVDEPGPWRPGTFRIFVSHTTAHKRIAGGVRDWMSRVDVDCFVAHTAIEPTRKWQDEIERALRTCHALVAMLTEDFVQSKWCDHEVGIAFGVGKLIVPVRLQIDPYGFIGQFQGLTSALPTTPPQIGVLAHKLFSLLGLHPMTQNQMAGPVIKRFAESWSWDNTRAVWPLVEALPKEAWTDARLRVVRQAAQDNVDLAQGVLLEPPHKGKPVPEVLEQHLQQLGFGTSATDDEIHF